ncbi:hypothetical protein N7456_013016 [Penicillium angulare]|uniref:Copper transport protein n=1 Tax=Penicillium angulare TaxID=116970 RepID=A0A9W9EKX5_9EURO|nr:hypothetical protein N7456_013016 [Penicillium angulare]
MDMSSGTSIMADMTMSSTAASATSSATSTGMKMGGSCKISMLWNWNTIDSCFISQSWHITSKGMFAGSCIGVVCLVISLEFLRRLGKEYDRLLLRQHRLQNVGESTASIEALCTSDAPSSFTPTIFQQAIRALLHMLQFAVAYFVMLLAMYYNGYFIICIFIGAYIGSFIFTWESISLGYAIKTDS